MAPAIHRHKTAIGRRALSKPMRLAQEAGLIGPERSVFDYGCGKGGDLTILRSLGVSCVGWDPVHRPDAERVEADVVNLGFVVNVIEDPRERASALRGAWGLARQVLIVSARLDYEPDAAFHREFGDGCLTRRDTFQKFYSQHELREWINATLQVESVAAAPGVFFVFRDEQLRQTFAAARYRRSTAAPRQSLSNAMFQEHRELLQGVMDFVAARGRLPEGQELDLSPLVGVFGSVRRAFALVERVTGADGWQKIRDERSQDLLVWLALAQFGKRPRFCALSAEMQADVRAFFGAYSRACESADELLFSAGKTEAISAACAAAPCGKLTPEALYVHTSGIGHLPPLLRVYEGCARNYVGVVEGANLVKLHRLKPKVSYLSYPEFDSDPHPALAGALVVPLNSFDVKYWNYLDAANPPILHRKEEFVPGGYPGRDKFAKLTKQEERRGLYEDTSRIGRRDGWTFVLEEKQVKLRGHQLIRRLPR